jgi:ABC-type polysaccharide/polyol phosphate transport system ATPase subunit
MERRKKRRSRSKLKPASESKEVKETLFKLNQIDFKVPRGQLVAIVGAGALERHH